MTEDVIALWRQVFVASIAALITNQGAVEQIVRIAGHFADAACKEYKERIE